MHFVWLFIAFIQAIPEHVTSSQISVGLLMFIEIQVANLQIQVRNLNNSHKRKK